VAYTKAKTGREYKTIFYRDAENNQLDFDKITAIQAESIKAALEPETLVVSLGEKLKVPKLRMVYDWFLYNEAIDFSNDFESLFRSNRLPENFVDNVNVQNKVVQFFSSFDEAIIGFDVKKVAVEDCDDDGGDERYIIHAKHIVLGSNDIALISLQEESKGTLEMVAFEPQYRKAWIVFDRDQVRGSEGSS